MNTVILYCMAFGAALGGADYVLGNRFGLGCRFAEAFRMLGSLGLSMAGIICLAPVLSGLLDRLVVPVFTALGFDPGMFGSILAIDMGGYQMAMALAENPAVGRFSGIIVSAIFGCTLVFTIPVGLGAIGEADKPDFTQGILLGIVSMPGGLILGGLLCGLSFSTVLWNCLPIFLICGLLLLGLVRAPAAMTAMFGRFARGIDILSGLGLCLAAVAYLSGFSLLPGLTPLEEAMEVVCAIAIAMLGSMPLAELLQRLLKAPFAWVGKHTGLNSVSTTALLIGMVSVVPALAMIPRMDKRGKVVNGAFVVCAASAFAAHLGFTLGVEPALASALLAAKLFGGALGIGIALAVTSR